ncbi:hypothetical protein SDC9_87637 [bioreactor metagenome]|uniref:O-antigen ligase-related domain-containing protein n=1 Tax=bioreactor metagenome TaxID=1076179 RepID=A0A644ZKX4_9ZZZZ|nr:O-antigen ligase family protein [Paludibacter sp.]
MSDKLKNIYFFIVVIFSGLSLTFFREHVGLIILWLIGLLIFRKETYYTQKKLLIAFGIWMGYFIINTLIIGSFHPMFMFSYVANIMIAYWLLGYYKQNIFLKYEDIIYKLTVVSLIFYLIQLIIPDPMYSLFKEIDMSQNLFPNRNYASIGIYTYHQVGMFELFPRNSGFCWEPGPFSSYVVLALFINIARNGIKLNDTKRLIVFLLALISSQSTTSFVVLLTIIIWYAWERYKNKAFVVLSVPLGIAIVIYLFVTLPWLQEKIITDSNQDVEEILSHAKKSGGSYAPGRFASFQLRWEDFRNYPIAGFGGNIKSQVGYFSDENVVAAINGIGTIMGKYGLIGSVIFLLLIFKTGRWLANFYHFKGYLIFPLLILMIGFGFGIIESPLIITLWMVPVFMQKQNKYFQYVKKNTFFH